MKGSDFNDRELRRLMAEAIDGELDDAGRAALNEIFDYGRPASVILVALLERNGRELPIEPDVVGLSPPLQPHEQIKLNGPSPLELVIVEKKG